MTSPISSSIQDTEALWLTHIDGLDLNPDEKAECKRKIKTLTQQAFQQISDMWKFALPDAEINRQTALLIHHFGKEAEKSILAFTEYKAKKAEMHAMLAKKGLLFIPSSQSNEDRQKAKEDMKKFLDAALPNLIPGAALTIKVGKSAPLIKNIWGKASGTIKKFMRGPKRPQTKFPLLEKEYPYLLAPEIFPSRSALFKIVSPSSHLTKYPLLEAPNIGRAYREALKAEQSLLTQVGKFTDPMQKPAGFPDHLNQFFNRCKIHSFRLAELGAEKKGILTGHLLHDKELFLLQRRTTAQTIRHQVHGGELLKSSHLHWHERLEHTLYEIRRVAQNKGYKEVYLAYDPTHFPVTTLLTNYRIPIQGLGTLSAGINAPPLTVIKVMVP